MSLNIKIDEKLSGDKYRQPIDRLSRELEGIVEETSNQTPSQIDEVRWDLESGYGKREGLNLYLRDWAGETKANFPADQLNDDYRVRRKLLRVWGDLLENRSLTLTREIKAQFAARESE